MLVFVLLPPLLFYVHALSKSHSTTQDDNVSYWDWKWYMPSYIGDMKTGRDRPEFYFSAENHDL